jgi:membrane protein YqaA with SNARE-associated domain
MTTRPSARIRRTVVGTLVVLGAVALSVWIYSLDASTVERFAAVGYPGVFVICVLANASIVLPGPGLLLVATFGGVLSPVGVGVAAALGATVGELVAYAAGAGGSAVVDKPETAARLEPYVRRYGAATIATLAFLPLPLFDVAGVLAGALKMPVQRFAFWCFVGKLPKMLLVAHAGAYSIEWIMRRLGG